jgi:hypothetical protein
MVVVGRPAPAAVAISPRSASLTAGEQTALTARVRDGGGQPMSYAVQWRSSNASVAAIDNDGTLRGTKQGDAMVYAVAGGATDSVHVTVVASPRVASAAPTTVTSPQPNASAPVPTPTAPPTRNADERPADRPSPAPAEASTAQVEAALMATARSLADGFARGQLGSLTATSQFSKVVRVERPSIAGEPHIQQRSITESRAEGDVAVPLRWTMFVGGVKNASVVLRITLELRDGTWRATSARNVNNP